jgi:hypothetical protein
VHRAREPILPDEEHGERRIPLARGSHLRGRRGARGCEQEKTE